MCQQDQEAITFISGREGDHELRGWQGRRPLLPARVQAPVPRGDPAQGDPVPFRVARCCQLGDGSSVTSAPEGRVAPVLCSLLALTPCPGTCICHKQLQLGANFFAFEPLPAAAWLFTARRFIAGVFWGARPWPSGLCGCAELQRPQEQHNEKLPNWGTYSMEIIHFKIIITQLKTGCMSCCARRCAG